MELSECYAILGLAAGASLAELKTAYRQLAKQWHPDRFVQDPEKLKQATTQFQKINEAYEILRLQGETRSTPPASQTKTSYRTTTTTDPDFYYWAAQKAVNLNAPQEAIDALTQAIRLKPDYLKAYQFRAFLHEQLGHQHQAAADFRKVAELQLNQTTAARTASRPEPEPSSKPPTQTPPAFTLLTQLSGG
ncbi:MAG: J domain-containing protein [Spirulina sp. SIO3F2]|nr:J domain-containing protein [Spirulina sp. SIO3F2]